MKLFKFLGSKTFFTHLILVGLFLGACFWGISSYLDYYTRHNETIKVPDLTGMAVPEVEQKLQKLELQYSILDSAEYIPAAPKGAVVDQYPLPGFKVKVGREVRLTLNHNQARKITMPNVMDKTKRRALYDLESKGFEVAKTEYVPYIGKDVVVDLKIGEESVQFGKLYSKGTAVTLVLGKGIGKDKIPVPSVHGLNTKEARQKLKENNLNVGAVMYDGEIDDSSKALVYRQIPNSSTGSAIRPGMPVDIWLTADYTKIPNDSLHLKTAKPDSTNENLP